MDAVVAQVDVLTAEITKGVYALAALYVLDVGFGILTTTKKFMDLSRRSGVSTAERFCRSYDELRAFLRPRTRHNQPVPASRRRLLHFRCATAALAILEAA